MRSAKLGVEAEPSTPQQLADRIATDLKKWHDVIVSRRHQAAIAGRIAA